MKISAVRIMIYLFPLTLGGFIYIIFRTETLIMFHWFKYLNISNEVDSIKNMRTGYSFPNWFIYNLPDGLWIFSYTAISLEIWKNSITRQNIFWVFSIPIISVLSEFLQLFKIIPGTFDFLDVTFYLLGTIFSFYISNKNNF